MTLIDDVILLRLSANENPILTRPKVILNLAVCSDIAYSDWIRVKACNNLLVLCFAVQCVTLLETNIIIVFFTI